MVFQVAEIPKDEQREVRPRPLFPVRHAAWCAWMAQTFFSRVKRALQGHPDQEETFQSTLVEVPGGTQSFRAAFRMQMSRWYWQCLPRFSVQKSMGSW